MQNLIEQTVVFVATRAGLWGDEMSYQQLDHLVDLVVVARQQGISGQFLRRSFDKAGMSAEEVDLLLQIAELENAYKRIRS